jgi:hypothetical protein
VGGGVDELLTRRPRLAPLVIAICAESLIIFAPLWTIAYTGADPDGPLSLLKHCWEAGVAGVQTSLGVLDSEQVRAIREFAERHALYVEGIVMPPQDASDLDRFEAESLLDRAQTFAPLAERFFLALSHRRRALAFLFEPECKDGTCSLGR